MAKVTMPQLGESVAEGTIGKWLKKPGDSVARDEPLLEVITDKVNAEVPSPFEGVLRKFLVEEGKTVRTNAEIAEIEEVTGAAAAPRGAGTAAAKAAAAGASAVATSPAARAAASPAPPARRPVPLPAVPATPAAPPALVPVMQDAADAQAGDPNARMTPAVRRMLREHGLTPAQIVGTGHAGRITRDDVMTFLERGDRRRHGPRRHGSRRHGSRRHGPRLHGARSRHCGRPRRRLTVGPLAPGVGVPSHAPGLAPSGPWPHRFRRPQTSPGKPARMRC